MIRGGINPTYRYVIGITEGYCFSCFEKHHKPSLPKIHRAATFKFSCSHSQKENKLSKTHIKLGDLEFAADLVASRSFPLPEGTG